MVLFGRKKSKESQHTGEDVISESQKYIKVDSPTMSAEETSIEQVARPSDAASAGDARHKDEPWVAVRSDNSQSYRKIDLKEPPGFGPDHEPNPGHEFLKEEPAFPGDDWRHQAVQERPHGIPKPEKEISGHDKDIMLIENILNKSSVQNLQSFYGLQRQEHSISLRMRELKEQIFNKLKELRTLENNWAELNSQILKYEKAVQETEMQIKLKTDEINRLTNDLKTADSARKDIRREEAFYCSNGEAYKSIGELINGLTRMSDSHFKMHVSEGRNDFANWVANVFNDQSLGDSMMSARTREELIRKLMGI